MPVAPPGVALGVRIALPFGARRMAQRHAGGPPCTCSHRATWFEPNGNGGCGKGNHYYFAARKSFEVADRPTSLPPCVGVAADGLRAGQKALQNTAVFNTSAPGGEAACWAPPQEV